MASIPDDPESSDGLARLARLSDDLAELGRAVFAGTDDSTDSTTVLTSLARVALERVHGADWVSITTLTEGEFCSAASTDERALRADALQYELGSGPCVDAIVENTTFRAPDLEADPRWAEFGKKAAERYGVRAMLAFRLALEVDGVISCLNIYATERDAFDEDSVATGLLLAVHGALVISAAADRREVAGLQQALEASREIGVALGIVMATYKVTREQAFSLLRIASQHSNRKLRDVAAGVALSGELPLPGPATG